ncbi:hypothetical protein ABBQ32_002131 [Trebouxia sp. C0010 RCD-2024]
MKISIELDIEAAEIPLATELLNTLRSLTDHIRVRQQPDGVSVPNGAPHHAESHSASRAGGPNFALALQAPAAAQEGAGPAEDQERHNQLTGYIRTVVSNYDEVLRQLGNALKSGDPEVDKLFVAAFSEVVLDPKFSEPDEELQAEHSTYMTFLGELDPRVQERISQPLVSALVKDMMNKRHAPRTAMMLPAMIYAHMAQLDIVNIRGTLKMVEKFLTNPGCEAVGLSMLGKTAEVCVDKVLQHASPAHLTSLTAALDQLDERYAYDVNYLNGFIKWRNPCFRVLTSRRQLHNQPVSALAYDPEGKQLISASRDGVVIVWDEWANPIRQHQLPNCYAIAMAYLADQRLIVIAGQPLAANKGPACIAAIGLVSPHELKGPWIRPTTTSMSSIVVLPGQQQFAVGETQTKPGGSDKASATVVHDCASLQQPANMELKPAATMMSPSGQVMCLTGYGQSKQVVLAGTSSGQVALWAIQNPAAPVKRFAMPEDAGRVLCLEFDGADTILAGTSNGTVVQWSMKGMAAIGKSDALPFVRTLSLDQHPVLKIQFWPNKTYGAQAAVITSHGCWTVNFSSSQPDVQHVQDVHNDDCSFTAAAWAGQFPYLYTGGASQKVYVCQLVPALTQHA